MKRFFTLTIFLALFALLLMPSTAHAKAVPGLVLKSTEITVTVTPLTPSFLKTTLAFGNVGSVPLGWKLYVGSDYAGCAVEAPVDWLAITPNNGEVKPRATTEAFLMVEARKLEAGSHHVLLCISTNDPFHPMTVIPFTVEVK